jgi:hypothetical protein
MKYFLLTISILFGACQGKVSDQSIEKLYPKKYLIPDSLIEHVPFFDYEYGELWEERFITNSGRQQSKNSAKGYLIPRFLIFQYNYSSKFNHKLESLKCDAIDSISSQSDNYMIISPEWEMKNKFTEAELDEVFKKQKFVIPDFSFYWRETRSDPNVSGLDNEYNIYILKKGSTPVLRKKYLGENNFLPDNLKHGYSSGFVLSETDKKIIFWSIAW